MSEVYIVDICVKILCDRPDSVQVTDGELTQWLPKSQIKNPEVISVWEEAVTLEIPEWLAIDRGFI